MRLLAALAVLLPLVRAACPDPIEPENPECSGCENQAAADLTCRAFFESVHTQEPPLFRCVLNTHPPSCLLATPQVLRLRGLYTNLPADVQRREILL